jgi:hypothetical protein
MFASSISGIDDRDTRVLACEERVSRIFGPDRDDIGIARYYADGISEDFSF